MIGITGHTSGIAKYIYDNYDCKGFSRSNGYDINNEIDRWRIINESREFEMFINCAHNKYGQALLLQDFVKYNPCMKVINVGSRVTEIGLPESHAHLLNYQKYKLKLKDICIKFGYDYKWFGYVATERINKELPDVEKITIEQAVSIILEN